MENRVAIITGGSRGLGRNTSVNLARRGVDVIFTYHAKKQDAESVVREIEGMGRKAAAFQLNTGDTRAFDGFASDVRKTLETWGKRRFDFLVNNAGSGLDGVNFMDTTESQFDSVVNVGFKGVYFLTQKLLPLMNDGGRIVNISSGLARVAIPGSSAYAAVKGAIEVFTRYLAKELGPRKITANVVAPGNTRWCSPTSRRLRSVSSSRTPSGTAGRRWPS
jgi:NAD(P)-dependent dehydrogenase (short-subunit alcohol dehydrogenase family)